MPLFAFNLDSGTLNLHVWFFLIKNNISICPFKNSVVFSEMIQEAWGNTVILAQWNATKCPSTDATKRGGYSHCSWFREDISMNVHHQIPTSSIFHYKANVIFGLETSEKIHQEGMSYTIHSFKYSLFAHQAANRKKKPKTVKPKAESWTHSSTLRKNSENCW